MPQFWDRIFKNWPQSTLVAPLELDGKKLEARKWHKSRKFRIQKIGSICHSPFLPIFMKNHGSYKHESNTLSSPLRDLADGTQGPR